MLSGARQPQDENVVHLTHVKHMHIAGIPGQVSRETFEQIAYSQYHVAHSILEQKKTRDPIVVMEGLAENLTLLNSSNMRADEALLLFPGGVMPEHFSLLGEHQKHFLVMNGGAHTLFYLNHLSMIYKAITPDEDEVIRVALDADEPEKMMRKIFLPDGSGLDSKYAALIKDKRELAIINAAKEAALEAKNPDVFVIFGGAHDLRARVIALHDPSVFFAGEIETRFLAHQMRNFLSAQTTYPFFESKQDVTSRKSKTGENRILINGMHIKPETILQLSAILICNLVYLFYLQETSAPTLGQKRHPL